MVLKSRSSKRFSTHGRYTQEVSTFLGEFSCEVAVYDNYHRSIKYSHPETQQDDAMHATNYALLLGIKAISHREDLDY